MQYYYYYIWDHIIIKMNTREKLKKILEKDDTEEGFGEFKSIIDEKYHNSKQLNQQDRSDLSLLLRWAVQ